MESIKKIYRIGNGPSYSHTIGPRRAAEKFLKMEPMAKKYVVTLYGSLAATGKGHWTDKAIIDVLGKEKTEIVWMPSVFLPFHPNGMKYESFDENNKQTKSWIIYSIGGGKMADENTVESEKHIYPHNSLNDILSFIGKEGMTFWEYVQKYEESDIWDYLSEVWTVMQKSVEDGLQEEGVLPGSIHLRRKAMSYYTKARSYKSSLYGRCAVQAYALAVAEHNAAGGKIATAPTCGSSGVLAAVLYHLNKEHGFSDKQIIWALATAGVFGNAKRNQTLTPEAIVLTGSLVVRSAPDDSGTELFVLHEGTKLTVKSELGEWCEVTLADGNSGWIKESSIGKI